MNPAVMTRNRLAIQLATAPRLPESRSRGIWQRDGGYDRNLFEPATVFEQIHYMHNNPLRRGLCAKPEDWLWSGAADYAGLRAGPLRLDRESLPVLLGS